MRQKAGRQHNRQLIRQFFRQPKSQDMLYHNRKKTVFGNTDGIAVVEATFVFPILFMLLFALVLLAMYLPQRIWQQQRAQYAADVIAAGLGDVWVYSDTDVNVKPGSISLITIRPAERYETYDKLENANGSVKEALYSGSYTRGDTARESYKVIADGMFKKVIVTIRVGYSLAHGDPTLADLTFIGFPEPFTVTATATSYAVNGDEFIRQVDWILDHEK